MPTITPNWLFALLGIGSVATAQWKEPVRAIHTWQGEKPGDQFGWVARVAGDVDRDGILDAAVTAPTSHTGGRFSGCVWLYSGKTGKVLHRIPGKPGDLLGYSVAGCGDVDGDGHADCVAGAPQTRTGAGKAYVFSGKDGSVLLQRSGQAKGDRFGDKVAGVGDVDGDGTPDFLVGAPNHDGAAGKDCGAAYLFSGKTKKLLHRFDGTRAGDNFGSTVAGTVHGKRILFAIGAANAGKNKGGRVAVFRGFAPEQAFSIEPDKSCVALGRMFLSIVGDIDADGTPDVYASDWSNNGNGQGSGRVYVYSGATGKPLHVLSGAYAKENFGIGPGLCGDVDGDKHDDLIIGAWQNKDGAASGGKVYVYSGKTGKELRTMTCTRKNDTFGFDAVGIGDVDGDSAIDFLITSAWSDVQGTKSGRVFVISGRSPKLEAKEPQPTKRKVP